MTPNDFSVGAFPTYYASPRDFPVNTLARSVLTLSQVTASAMLGDKRLLWSLEIAPDVCSHCTSASPFIVLSA